jgi:hypothetical protein
VRAVAVWQFGKKLAAGCGRRAASRLAASGNLLAARCLPPAVSAKTSHHATRPHTTKTLNSRYFARDVRDIAREFTASSIRQPRKIGEFCTQKKSVFRFA